MGIVFCFAAICASTGCALIFAGLPDAIPVFAQDSDFEIIGGDSERVLIARTDYSQEFEEFTRVASVDLRSLQSEVVLTDVNSSVWSMRSDGSWVVWLDHSADDLLIRAHDLRDGTEALYMVEPPIDGSLGLVQVDRGRLLVEVDDWDSNISALVVVDLATGDQTTFGPFTLADGWLNSVTLSGDLLVTRVFPEIEAGTQDLDTLLAGANLDLVNLSTGEQSTLVSDVGSKPWAFNATLIANDQVIWVEQDIDRRLAEVRSYDLQTGEIDTLLDYDTSDFSDTVLFLGGGDDGLLFTRNEYEPPTPPLFLDGSEVEKYILWSFDGQAKTLFEITTGHQRLGSTPLEYVGHFVVYRHPFDGDFVIYDVKTQSQRRVDPFAD